MFHVHLLPAAHGDSLILEYGPAERPKRVLVDGGAEHSYKQLKAWIEKLPAAERRFELLVVTHVDADHIGGVVRLLELDELGVRFDHVLFNGYAHLDADAQPPVDDLEHFGALQGERLSTQLLARRIPWNHAFRGGSVCVREDGNLPVIDVDGGLRLTVLGPTTDKLAKLEPEWERACEEAGIHPTLALPPYVEGDEIESMGALDVDALADAGFSEDRAAPNGSSISLLAEYRGKRLLLAADAHPSTLLPAIRRLARRKPRLALTAFKLPHHASKNNVSRELIESVTCANYLVSTNGAQFKHPDREAIARVVKYGDENCTLHFNYRTKFNSMWDDALLQEDWSYRARYPEADGSGLRLDMDALG